MSFQEMSPQGMGFQELLQKFSAHESRNLENWNFGKIRHNAYSEQGQAALSLFEKAVGRMKQRSEVRASDPLGWSYQAGIHGIWNLDYENPSVNVSASRVALAEFAEKNGFDTKENVLSGNTVLNNCSHFLSIWSSTGEGFSAILPGDGSVNVNANFLPWHRLYLEYFEEIVRENLRQLGENNADSWALPYWDYLNENQLVMPEKFRDPQSPLYTQYRNPELNAGKSIQDLTNDPGILPSSSQWPELTYPALYANSYLSANSKIEVMPHDAFHVLSGTEGNLFGSDGLLLTFEGAGFDPVFWVHHAFIDKLWSEYNASENAYYAYESDLDKNKMNYMFLRPTQDGSLDKEVISYWGSNSPKVISKIYNPNYGYDYLVKNTILQGDEGPNKVLAIIQSSAFRPTVLQQDLTGFKFTPQNNSYYVALPFGDDITLNSYRALTAPGENYRFSFVSDISLTLPAPPANVRFILTTENGLDEFQTGQKDPSGFGFVMQQGMVSLSAQHHMHMIDHAVIDWSFDGYSYIPSTDNGSEKLFLLALTNSEDTSLHAQAITLNQNLNVTNVNGSTFDAAAYFAANPDLLSSQEALSNPEQYFEEHDRSKGIIAPSIGFRAAALGMQYLMANNNLLHAGISSSPYSAIDHYLSQGQAQGLSLGDGRAHAAKSWFVDAAPPQGIVLDFSNLDPEVAIEADLVIGKDAQSMPSIGFYRVIDAQGTVNVDGVKLKPGDAGYATLATSQGNLFTPLTGLNANSGMANHRHGVSFGRDDLLAPFAQVSGHQFFSFSAANPDGFSHFRLLGTNIFGLEDSYGGGDADFDDTLVGFKFPLLEPSPINNGYASFSIHGTAVVGGTLMAHLSQSDPDGNGTGFSYIWQSSSDGVSWMNIGNSDRYTIADNDAGKQIQLVVSYTDGQGFEERVITGAGVVPPLPILSIRSESLGQPEGNIGTTPFGFTISRSGDLRVASKVAWSVVGSGANPASALDFAAARLPSGEAMFEVGQDSVSLVINVLGDRVLEADEAFSVALASPAGASLSPTSPSATSQIQNDDLPAVAYTLSASSDPVYEGNALRIGLSTTNVAAGERIYWQLGGNGITASDFNSGLLSGECVIGSDGQAAFTTVLAADPIVDPNELLQVRVFRDAARTQQVGSTLQVTIKEPSVGVITDGADVITGTFAGETLTGVPAGSTLRGRNSIDRLTGGGGEDLFVLGDVQGPYYNDDTSGLGTTDMAVITDFNTGDRIQLYGTSSDYVLNSGFYAGSAGVSIRVRTGSLLPQSGGGVAPLVGNEAIGFVQGATLASLNLSSASQFKYLP